MPASRAMPGRGRAAVARLEEGAAGGVEHRLPPFLRAEPRPRRAHAQYSTSSAGTGLGLDVVVRLLAHGREADHRADERDHRRDQQPVVESVDERLVGRIPGRRASSTCRAATIAPVIAIPSEPPTWRALFSTAEPTPALSRWTEPIAAAVVGVIVIAMPTPPMIIAGQERPEASSPVESCEKIDERDRDEEQPAADERPRAEPVGQPPGLRRDAG